MNYNVVLGTLLFAMTIPSGLSIVADGSAVRVNCKTHERMVFQIHEAKIRSLLKVNNARELLLFSEDPITHQPIPSCSAFHAVSASAKWSKSFDFVTYGLNSTCNYRTLVVEKAGVTEQSNVVDISIKVLKSDDGVGVGKRGKIRLTCTMLVQKDVETGDPKLKVESATTESFLSGIHNHKQPSMIPDIHTLSVPSMSEHLQGSLVLRFFKNVRGQNAPVPALTIMEGEDIYLVAALKSTESYAVLRPINCTIRSVISPKTDSSQLPIPGSVTAAITIHEFSVLENGCQSEGHSWHMLPRTANQTNFRIYYTKFAAPMFSGSLRLNARCSINLCTQNNSNACIDHPQPIHEECFVETSSMPDFQFAFETITNITELPNIPSNMLLMLPTTTPLVTKTTATSSTVSTNRVTSAKPTVISTTTTTNQPNASKESEKVLFKRNITLESKRTNTVASQTRMTSTPGYATRVTSTPGYANGDASALFFPHTHTGRNITSVANGEINQELKYCFLQKTVTIIAVFVVVLLIFSIILISCSVLYFCRQRRPVAILSDEFHAA